jgi:3D (Asp-Asp-Asp) domain-containing protein
MTYYFKLVLASLFLVVAASATPVHVTTVTVTAYSSRTIETDDTPFIAAWGDSVRTGTIAVSRDLLQFFGRGQPVLLYLDGLDAPPDTFVVNDKMNKRWTKRVDIWFKDTTIAQRFGTKKGIILLWSPMLIPKVSMINL